MNQTKVVNKLNKEGFPSYIIDPVIQERDLGNFKKAFEFSCHDARLGGYVTMEITYEKLADFIDNNKLISYSHSVDHKGEHIQKALSTPMYIDSLSKLELYNLIIEIAKEA